MDVMWNVIFWVVQYKLESWNYNRNGCPAAGAAIFRTTLRWVRTPFRKNSCHRPVILCHVLCSQRYPEVLVCDDVPSECKFIGVNMRCWISLSSKGYFVQRLFWRAPASEVRYRGLGGVACWLLSLSASRGPSNLQPLHRRAIAFLFDHIRYSGGAVTVTAIRS